MKGIVDNVIFKYIIFILFSADCTDFVFYSSWKHEKFDTDDKQSGFLCMGRT